MDKPMAVVTGAGGFIGGHLCVRLMEEGYHVRGVDIKLPEFRDWTDICHGFVVGDMTNRDLASYVFNGASYVFALAADMGGMEYISYHDAAILRNNLMINLTSIDAAYQEWKKANTNLQRYFFSSSVCVYPEESQMNDWAVSLDENSAYPAAPQDAYGWEKLTAENLCMTYRQDYGLPTRIARFHNCFGPYGTWQGGREKVVAALCRKIAESKLRGDTPVQITMIGDGKQLRPFVYVDDLVEGILKVAFGNYEHPVNIGPNNDAVISINDLAYIIADAAGVEDLYIQHVSGPEGVRSRGASNKLLKTLYRWEPPTKLVDGLAKTYKWIEEQVKESLS